MTRAIRRIVLALSLGGCSESISPSRNEMSASVDGVAWSMTSYSVHPFGDGFLTVSGTAEGGSRVLSLTFRPVVGRQVLTPPNVVALISVGFDSWSTFAPSSSGSVTVDSSRDHRITGTFEFTAGTFRTDIIPTRQVTAGRFALDY
jgi:hypothetical protein